VPCGVVPLVDTLSVVEPDAVTVAGLNDAVAPGGRPVALKLTVPLNPAIAVTVAEYVVPPPGDTDRDAGVAESEKSRTVMVRVTAGLASPPLSVTVNDAV